MPEIFGKRQFSVTVNDALRDPNLLKPNQKANAFGTVTLKPGVKLNAPKDPGYGVLGKRGQEQHDCWTKTHYDYQGRPIMKLHEGEEFSKNNMSASFYHEFSPNKHRAD